ncbi:MULTISPECIES: WGR domain-containing protein [unclassified Beijerinckia]|uniref:WGR domain-containing protein n=1 Tax=unclassified Beijerinckia TaxID=2638183 RepID=UPI000B8414FD|nr:MULTISPECIES: WGR domain-containing protein [unclassified Beijerinckia]MDH7798943.1 putative DNA-binding WGR domain protein [Beijerinckia sp. GAS462]
MSNDLDFSIHLRRIDHSRNMARFYSISLQPTLFSSASVVRQWGRIGTIGRRRIDLYDTTQEANLELTKLLRQKCRRGYVEVGGRFRASPTFSHPPRPGAILPDTAGASEFTIHNSVQVRAKGRRTSSPPRTR